MLEAHPASIQDRDGGGPLLCASRGSFPFIEKVFADSGNAGGKVATATVIAVEIVRKSPDQVGFAVQPRRWVVERFFAWINRNRRLAKDFEATIASARAFLYAASTSLTTEPGATFTREHLIEEAHKLSGGEVDLQDDDVKIVLSKQGFLKRAGKELYMR